MKASCPGCQLAGHDGAVEEEEEGDDGMVIFFGLLLCCNFDGLLWETRARVFVLVCACALACLKMNARW